QARQRKRALEDQAPADRPDAVPVTSGAPVTAGGLDGAEDDATLTGRAVHAYARPGPRNQPRRTPRSKR
ncbi:MAG: hypothetical protein ACRCY8_16940, partial [Dermatophilaceae bacterium]